MKKRILSLTLAGLLLSTTALAAPARETVPSIAPSGMALEGDTLYVADSYHRSIWTVEDGEAEWLAGSMELTDPWGQPVGGYRDGDFAQALFSQPWAIAPYGDGFLVTDAGSHTLRYLDLEEERVYTAAGTGEAGYENGLGIEAAFDTPAGLAVDDRGTVYIADSGNHVIRAMDEEGEVTTFAGGAEGCALGDLEEVRFSQPTGLCWADGVLYVADTGNHRIVAIEDGRVSLVAGAEQTGDAAYDGGYLNHTPELARFSSPQGVAVAEDGTVYIADTGNGAVRVLRDGYVTTLTEGASGTTYPVSPRGLLLDGETLYVGDVFSRVLLCCDSAVEEPGFRDVPADSWYASAVCFAVSNGLFQGTGPETFSPDAEMTRGMAVTVLARYDGVEFTQDGDWYAAGARWAAEQGVSDGADLDQSITREQLAVMLYRCAGSPALTGGDLAVFSDGRSVSDWATRAMLWAIDQGLLTGVGGGLLDPQGEVSRAQMALILQRYAEAAF